MPSAPPSSSATPAWRSSVRPGARKGPTISAITVFGFTLGLPQNFTEELLWQWAEECGVQFVRGSHVETFRQGQDGVEVDVVDAQGLTTVLNARYLIGADGGSTDPGPHYLGSGTGFCARLSVKRDLRLMLLAAMVVVVNFVVITKGAGRIAEVAARFALDAMPGKQMAIDADLSSGLIDEAEAKKRRKELEQESTFFGAMDGASKFVRGDAVAGLIIVAINVIGGILMAAGQATLAFSESLPMAIAARAKSPCMACTMAKNPANNAAVVNRLGST